jgi:hypothetical protein
MLRHSFIAMAIIAAPLAAQEKIDADAINRIKTEEQSRSQVREIASWAHGRVRCAPHRVSERERPPAIGP